MSRTSSHAPTGFRQGQGPHDALEAVGRTIVRGPMAYVLETDIRSYFDAIVRRQLMAFIERRIGDRNILRLIRTWIHVGVVEDGGSWSRRPGPDKGR
jgi:RNA-directed DNA polymerase